MFSKTEIQATLLALTATTVAASVWYWFKNRKVYVKVGTVKELYYFPLKSAKGIKVEKLKCGKQGVAYLGTIDRQFMVRCDAGSLVSQREEPRLVLISPEVKEDTLVLHAPDCDSLILPLREGLLPDDKVLDCQLHADDVVSLDCGDEAAKWFQNYLKRSDVRLVRVSPKLHVRQYKRGNVPIWDKLKKEKPVNFQDEAAFHVISESSLKDLRARMDYNVTVHNFRPNIFVEGSPAYDEDNWKCLKFSSGAEMDVELPCGRCLLTTNDPETGIKTDKEPLVALRKYRMCKDKAIARALQYSPGFGVVCWTNTTGNVCVGDDVYAVKQKGHFKF